MEKHWIVLGLVVVALSGSLVGCAGEEEEPEEQGETSQGTYGSDAQRNLAAQKKAEAEGRAVQQQARAEQKRGELTRGIINNWPRP